MANSLTEGIKDYLNATDQVVVTAKDVQSDGIKSVYELAVEAGLTLKEYILANPDTALLMAEKNVATWNSLLSLSILTGTVSYGNTKTRLTKNTSDLMKERIRQANSELNEVKKYASFNTSDKKNRLISSLYNKAVEEGDTRALLYMIDRIDGKIGTTDATQIIDYNQLNVYNILHSLYDKQLEVLNSGPGAKMVMCSRRSGKTHLAVAMCLISCLSRPNTSCIYIGETMRQTEQLFDKAFRKLAIACGLKDRKGNPLNYKKLDNGSNIIIRGLSNTSDPDTIRGHSAEVIIIDEFFHLKDDLLKYLVQEVLEPMQLDYAQTYKMLMIGSPPRMRGTYGDIEWDKNNCSHYAWTWRDNPYVNKHGEEYLAKLFAAKGIDPNSAFARREYGGERIYDSDFLLYPHYFTYNPDVMVPQYHIDLVTVGIDYGTSDSTALIAVAWDTTQRRGYVFYEKKFNIITTPNGMSLFQYLKHVVKDLWRMSLDYFPNLERREANKRVKFEADYNGMSQGVSQMLQMEIQLEDAPNIRLNIVDAHREDGIIMQDKLRDLFRLGNLMVPEGGPTSVEMELTALKKDSNDNPTTEIDDKQYHPDLLHALRYAMWNAVGNEAVREDEADLLDGMCAGQSPTPIFEEESDERIVAGY